MGHWPNPWGTDDGAGHDGRCPITPPLCQAQWSAEAYRNLQNPISATDANIKAGKQQYEVSCAVCHGSSARGDGPAASQLDPSPTDLQFTVHTPIASDGFLFWSIAEGGAPIGSAVPVFKSSLKAEDIWRVILYLRQQ